MLTLQTPYFTDFLHGKTAKKQWNKGKHMQYHSHSPEETEEIGARYAESLRPGDTVALEGGLGAGKTAFVRGVLRGLGYAGRVTSPTFAIANEYETPRGAAVHCDMYRILDEESLYELGFEEYLDGRRILLIEWSENIAYALPEKRKTVRICYGDTPDGRTIETVEAL